MHLLGQSSSFIYRAICTVLIGAFLIKGRCAEFATFTIPDEARKNAIQAGIWYPCAEEQRLASGAPLEQSRLAKCMQSVQRPPIVIISHGSGGSFQAHSDLAIALADAGFVVASINHAGDTTQDLSERSQFSTLWRRANHISKLISVVESLEPWRSGSTEPVVGVYGYSRGGLTALMLAGAKPDIDRMDSYCKYFKINMCIEASQSVAMPPDVLDKRVRALVLADPLNFFTKEDLIGVTLPAEVWASQMGGESISLTRTQELATNLPTKPRLHVVENANHYSFLKPCTQVLIASGLDICKDENGFDREQFHVQFDESVVQFFSKNLGK